MEELAEKLAESEHGLDNAEALLERWTGHPERIAEDIFRVRNLDSGDIEDLSLFYPYQPKLMHAYFFGDGRIINVYKGRRMACRSSSAFVWQLTGWPLPVRSSRLSHGRKASQSPELRIFVT